METAPLSMAAAQEQAGDAEVHRLHPIRVLLVARDRRFLRMAAALLEQRGCTVEATERPSELLPIVRRGRTDVVVVDGSGSLTAAVRAIAAVAALDPPVGGVVVAEGASRQLGTLRVLAKWGPFDSLVHEVERAALDLNCRGGAL